MNTAFKALCVLVLVAFFGLDQAAARDLTEAERASLAETVEGFDRAMQSRDYAVVVKVIPPRVLEHFSRSADIEVNELRKVIIEQMTTALAEVKIDSFGMDLAKAEHKELADGTPYVLIPTETVIAVSDGRKSATRTYTLALMDSNVWYLLRISDLQQLAVLRQVYPEYEGVQFPRGSMEALKE